MSAYPEEIDKQSPIANWPSHRLAAEPEKVPAGLASRGRLWRLVTSDGTTSTLEGLGGGSAAPLARQLAPRCSNLFEQPLEQQLSSPGKPTAAMPRPVVGSANVLSLKDHAAASRAQPLPQTPAADCTRPPQRPLAQLKREGAARRGGCSNGSASALVHRQPISGCVLPPRAGGRCREIDSQLARIIELWPELPRGVQAAMVAMIETVRRDD